MKRLTTALLLVSFAAFVGCGGGDEGGGTRKAPSARKATPKSNGGGTSETPENTEPTGWATLTGTFVFDGDAPERAAIAPTKDTEVCGAFNLRQEDLVVNADTQGIRDVFVYLRTRVAHHESYDSQQDATVEFSNKDCRFAPHAVAVWLPQTLLIKNEDPVAHNANIDAKGDPKGSSNRTLAGGGATQAIQFGKRQNIPIAVNCSIHNWMNGYILPRDNPYFAVTDENGKFTIENVPAGIELEFQVWHGESGNLAAKSDWANGRFKVTLEPDQTMDLGEVTAVPALFNK